MIGIPAPRIRAWGGARAALESHLLIAADLSYISAADGERLVVMATIVEKMLFKLMQMLADAPA